MNGSHLDVFQNGAFHCRIFGTLKAVFEGLGYYLESFDAFNN